MIGWAGYTDYLTAHPGTTLTEVEFTRFAERAAAEILRATEWRAQQAAGDDAVSILRSCQLALIDEVLLPGAEAGAGTVTSANNDGYSESYLSGASLDSLQHNRTRRLIARYLLNPVTGWMIYAGGVYHAPARR